MNDKKTILGGIGVVFLGVTLLVASLLILVIRMGESDAS